MSEQLRTNGLEDQAPCVQILGKRKRRSRDCLQAGKVERRAARSSVPKNEAPPVEAYLADPNASEAAERERIKAKRPDDQVISPWKPADQPREEEDAEVTRVLFSWCNSTLLSSV